MATRETKGGQPADTTSARVDDEAAAVWVATESLIPWQRNPRKNDDNVKRVMESIKRFGFSSPIIARKADGEVIAGHTRLKAAAALGIAKVPVRYMDLDPADAHLLALADNRLNELSPWDNVELTRILGEYGLEDVALAGWSSDDLSKIGDELAALAGDKEVVEDEPPPVPKVAVTKTGDVWILGNHRLLCGDSSVRTCYDKMDCTRQFDLVVTDPPYGLDYVGKTSEALEVHNDSPETLQPLLEGSFDALLARCKPGAVWYVFAPPGLPFIIFANALKERGIWRQTLAWVKDAFVFGRSDYHGQYESIFYGWKPGAAHRPPPDRKQTSVWNFDRPRVNREHPTMKPVALIAHAIEMSSVAGDWVADPFAGSGTTLIACEQLGRVCRAVEFSPNYCDVIVERWQSLTGGKASLRSS